ncbi:MAG: WD40 repeat domain-containing protein [Gemmataceae bacterium]|nr:WD40 repeat domain-containing protein [Gemmataceae bacterium]
MAVFSLTDSPWENGLRPPYVERVYGTAELRAGSDVLAVAFDAAGTLWSIEEEGVLRGWSSQGRQQQRYYLSDLITVWSFSADGSWLAGGNDELVVWQVGRGDTVRQLARGNWITAVGWDWQGRRLVCGREDGGVEIWQVCDGRLVRHWPGTGTPVAAVAFSPDGRWLAVAGEDRHIRVWETSSGKLQVEWLGHPDRIAALVWSPQGHWLISAGWDSSARVWRLDASDPLMLLNSHAEQVVALAYSPDGRYLACADSDNLIHLWSDPERAVLARVLQGHPDEIRCLTFSPDGRRLASGGAGGALLLWDVDSGTVAAGNRQGLRHRLAYVAGGCPRLASVFAGQTRLWEVATGRTVELDAPPAAHSLAASRDGRWLAIGGADHYTRLYDLTQSQSPAVLEATKPPIGHLTFDVLGSRLAHTSPADGLVWIWDTTSKNPELILIEAADGCTLEGICFHPDGERLAAGGLDYLATGQRTGAVTVWHLPTREQHYTIDVGVTALTVDPQGRWWAGAAVDGTVCLWNAADGEELAVLPGPVGRISDLICSPCGQYLAACGEDQTIRIWTVRDGQTRVIREMEMPVDTLAFSSDGRLLFAAWVNGMACAIDFAAFIDD